MLLSRKEKSFKDVVAVLKEYAANVEGEEGTEGAFKRDILSNLIQYIDAV